MFRKAASLMALAVLSGCSLTPESASRGSHGSNRPAGASYATSPAARQCLADLSATKASFTPLPDRYFGEGCSRVNSVTLASVRGDAAEFGLSNLAAVSCPVANSFAGWARFGVDRAARQMLGSPLARIETMGSFACRNVAGTSRRSAHASANAIDVSAFLLMDGRRISVLQHWNGGTAAEREFLRVVQASACKRFGTVLGPEYNAAHRDHLHMEPGQSGREFCR